MLTRFREALARANPSKRRDRSWIFVPYDQLTDELGPLSREAPETLGILLVEAPAKAARRPYHRQKLALVLANLRHFALEQAARGVAVEHVVSRGDYGQSLRDFSSKHGPLRAMLPAEWELRRELEPVVADGLLTYVPHEGWLTTVDDFTSSQAGPPWRMDAFYRQVRRRTGLLMKGGKPEGGKFSFDAENRKRWPGKPAPPEQPRFVPDEITREVAELVERKFSRHPGVLRLDALPATRADAEQYWSWVKEACLPQFGPFEDAMSVRSRRLFHSGVSALLNLSRLPAARIVREAAGLDAPLASREGFVRQILGWREFVRHVHAATEGFRNLSGVGVLDRFGDGGFERWAGEPWSSETGAAPLDGGADPHRLAKPSEAMGVPPALWGAPSGFECLDQVVSSVWDEAYSHHITRLMVLSNLGALLDLSPRELTDWFWVAYGDAYDWVVEPNVLAMGTFAVGDLMTTKPYVAGAAYIDKMSDFCRNCAFDPRRTCPFTRLYWAFLERHEKGLAENPRLRLPLQASRARAPAEKELDRETYRRARLLLGEGRRLSPADFEGLERSG